jgi:hypothetical protein
MRDSPRNMWYRSKVKSFTRVSYGPQVWKPTFHSAERWFRSPSQDVYAAQRQNLGFDADFNWAVGHHHVRTVHWYEALEISLNLQT